MKTLLESNSCTSRRQFLKATAMGALASVVAPAFVRGANLNSRLQVASVGVNGMGFTDVSWIGSHKAVKFVGFCDVDTTRFGKADEAHPGVPHFQDFREMFSKLGGQFDAASVSTPDHMHAYIALDAMRRGKHVFCQKPLTHTVWESRQMRLQAEKSKVITQMGNQIHSHKEYRTAVELLRDGVIGKVKAVHSWVGVQGNNYSKLQAPPSPGPVPASLNWQVWVGTAPMRDYAPDVYHPFKWRDWQDFGSGALGDFGCHILDPIFTALDIREPMTVRAEHDGINQQVWPVSETVHYLFPGTRFTADGTLPVTWYDGGRQPDKSLAQMPESAKLPGSGSLIIGEEGNMVLPHVGMPQLYPVKKFRNFDIKAESQLIHWHVWVEGVLSGKKTSDGFDYAGPLAEAVQLGNVAARFPGQELKWDAKALRITNHAEASARLTKQYRQSWEIHAVA
ncbi:MAG: twin-arginine translocation signal domain-containing protein [Verrucomicrobia bacterium]|nr:twin-arginine translocation signal domain-containing protein [Verrucomicrobiota bacterium]